MPQLISIYLYPLIDLITASHCSLRSCDWSLVCSPISTDLDISNNSLVPWPWIIANEVEGLVKLLRKMMLPGHLEAWHFQSLPKNTTVALSQRLGQAILSSLGVALRVQKAAHRCTVYRSDGHKLLVTQVKTAQLKPYKCLKLVKNAAVILASDFCTLHSYETAF